MFLLIKKLKKELLKKDKMMLAQSRHAIMGEMISMIAHQWRQPISVIAMDANNILVDSELSAIDAKELKETAQNIIGQTQELSKTIDDFRDFFKSNKSAQKVLYKEILDDVLKIMGKSLQNNNIELVLNIDKTISVTTLTRELMQVILNIIQNAKEVLIDKEMKKKTITLSLKQMSQTTRLLICDNAGGIDKALLDEVFKPYFTTKSEDKGTGIGLYISKVIVEKHLQGTLKVYNESKGACFQIELPLNAGTDN